MLGRMGLGEEGARQEAKFVERAGSTLLLPGLARADFIFEWIGLMKYILCYPAPSVHWTFLDSPAGKYLLSEISKRGQGQPKNM